MASFSTEVLLRNGQGSCSYLPNGARSPSGFRLGSGGSSVPGSFPASPGCQMDRSRPQKRRQFVLATGPEASLHSAAAKVLRFTPGSRVGLC